MQRQHFKDRFKIAEKVPASSVAAFPDHQIQGSLQPKPCSFRAGMDGRGLSSATTVHAQQQATNARIPVLDVQYVVNILSRLLITETLR